MSPPNSVRFVVTVGTDHHPFDRLIGWVNDWIEQHPDHLGSFFVQSGPSSTRPASPSERFVDAGRLERLLDEADVIVCHGGPGSIFSAWQRGTLPIVVPRLRKFGEVVDDHQVDFCHKLAALGRIRLAEDAASLGALLDAAMADLADFRYDQPDDDVEAAVARFDALVGDMLSTPRRTLRSRLRSR